MSLIRGFYITQWDNDEQGVFPGPAKKINAQIAAMKSYGYEVQYLGGCSVNGNPTSIKKIKGMIESRLPFMPAIKNPDYSLKRMPDISNVKDADFIYIRFYWGDYPFGRAIKKLRNQNPNAVIFLEFPDYPYLPKAPGTRFLYMRLKDRFCSKKYKNNIDYMVTMEYVKEIYNVQTIHMYNGIDTQKVRVRECSNLANNEIGMGFVATAQRAHGLDRLINGLYEYYKSSNCTYSVKLYIAGGGEELEILKKKVKEFNLEEYVIFYGYLYGKDLDSLFDKMDIGIDYLAPSRDKIRVSSSLKTREYLARGIPIITGAYLDVCMDKKFQHLLVIEDDETSIDIYKIIDFYLREYRNGANSLIKEIREFAEEYIDIKKTMLFVKERIEALKNEL